MSFNPANFPWMSARAEEPTEALGHAPAIVQIIADLERAAAIWAQRRDEFAQGKSETCLDIAAKLERFGSFASEKQAGYAAKLIEWTKPRQPAVQPEYTLGQIPGGVTRATPVAEEPKGFKLPKLHALMQRLSKLEIGAITLARKNGDSLVWVKLDGIEGVVGKLVDGGVLTLFARCPDAGNLYSSLLSIEEDPEAAAARHGKASGRCSVCSRDLTDPESIERGIGPICAVKFQF
jgi:hypothetical protein